MVTADFGALEALLPPTFINTLGQYNAFGPSCAEDFDDLDDSEMDALPLPPAAGGSDLVFPGPVRSGYGVSSNPNRDRDRLA